MVKNWSYVQFPCHLNEKGATCVLELFREVPFEIKRIYYIFNTSKGIVRGKHAHRHLQQILIPISGNTTIKLFDGTITKTLCLNSPEVGLHLKPLVWREIHMETKESVCLVIASDYYKPSDYINSLDEFLQIKAKDEC